MKALRVIRNEKGWALFVVLSFTLALLVTIGGLVFSKGAKAGTSLCDCGGDGCDFSGCFGTTCEQFCPPPPQRLPHIKCYVITPGTALNEPVTLLDQFHECTEWDNGHCVEGGEKVTVRSPSFVCTITTKIREGDADGEVVVDSETVNEVFKCYKVTPSGTSLNQPVRLCDQFHPADKYDGCEEGTGENVTVRTAEYLCTPAEKIELPKPTPKPTGPRR